MPDLRTYKINYFASSHGLPVRKTSEVRAESLMAAVKMLEDSVSNLVVCRDNTRYLNKEILTKEDRHFLDLTDIAI